MPIMCTPEESERTLMKPNAFEITMAASKVCTTNQLSIANVQNNKDKLYDDVLSFIQMSSL